MANTVKRYIWMQSSDGLLLKYGSIEYDDTHTPLEPPTPGAGELIEEVSAVLGGLTLAEFYAQKKASVSGGVFVEWLDRAAAPGLAVDVNPKADGSNVPTVTVSGAPANSDYAVEFDYHLVDCNLPSCEGTTDGAGGATFKIKVLGPNYEHGSKFNLTVSPRGHDDFQHAELEVTIDPGAFT